MVLLVFVDVYPYRVEVVGVDQRLRRAAAAGDYPIGIPEHLVATFIADNSDPDTTWEIDGIDDAALIMPSLRDDVRFMEWIGRAGSAGATPTGARRWLRATSYSDVRHLLPEVTVPVLVLHRTDNLLIPAEHGAYLAHRLPNAKYVEASPGADHVPFAGDAGRVARRDRGVRDRPAARVSADRVLTTVLFTDIVDSTAQRRPSSATARGVRELDAHDAIVRAAARAVRRARGQHDRRRLRRDVRRPTQAVRGAQSRSSRRHAVAGSRSARASTPASANGAATTSPASPCTSRPGSPRTPGRRGARRRARCVTSSRAPGLAFESRGRARAEGRAPAWELFAVQTLSGGDPRP